MTDEISPGQVCTVHIDRRRTCDGGRYYETPWGLMPTPKKEVEELGERLYREDKKAKLEWLNARYKKEEQ